MICLVPTHSSSKTVKKWGSPNKPHRFLFSKGLLARNKLQGHFQIRNRKRYRANNLADEVRLSKHRVSGVDTAMHLDTVGTPDVFSAVALSHKLTSPHQPLDQTKDIP